MKTNSHARIKSLLYACVNWPNVSSLFASTCHYFMFQVFARETQTVEKYSSNVTVIVKVEDRNDNSPRFDKPFYEVTVDEELPIGTLVLQVFYFMLLFTVVNLQFHPLCENVT